MTCFYFCSRKKRASSAKQTVDFDKGIENTKLFTYRELQRATENFRISNKIGEGGFGSVYKGRLRDGTLVAIKVLAADSRQGVREFLTEINVIAEIQHENLVELYGCCVEGNHRILVYGYLENNSLGRTLLGGSRSNLQLSWHTRRKICIGVALLEQRKFSNILCTFEFCPISVHLRWMLSCYLAPEYAIQGQLTRKADVYGYGVLLLEIVSGRTNTNRRLPRREHYLLERAWEMYERGELEELVDVSLNGDYDIGEANRYLKIGLMCVQEAPKLRPSMSTVVKKLMGETDVNGMEIARPGLLSEFMALKGYDDQTDRSDMKKIAGVSSSSPYKLLDSSSSSENTANSYGTMTFNSVYDLTD